MSRDLWESTARDVLDGLHETHSYRERSQFVPLDATHVQWQGERFVNFASNDYLGLTHHPVVIEAAQRAVALHGAGSGASPLVCGYTPAHASAELRIARWKGTEACVLLPSGYQASHAAIQALAAITSRAEQGNRKFGGRAESGEGVAPAEPRDSCQEAFGSAGALPSRLSLRLPLRAERCIRFLLDKLCHASLIDAVRASGRPFRIFPHGNLDKLERLLAGSTTGQVQVVVTEAVFSMDGDTADLAALAGLKKKYGFVLLLDEAHSSGVYGAGGSGLAAELGLSSEVDVSITTLSKAIGCVGGAVCGSSLFCEALVNFARACIYSTSLPAHVAATAQKAIDIMQSEPTRQQRLGQLSQRVRAALAQSGLVIPAGNSPIIPVIVGSESTAIDAAQFLASRRMLVPAIRPPTVARGASRLRITLSSEHTDREVNELIAALLELGSSD